MSIKSLLTGFAAIALIAGAAGSASAVEIHYPVKPIYVAPKVAKAPQYQTNDAHQNLSATANARTGAFDPATAANAAKLAQDNTFIHSGKGKFGATVQTNNATQTLTATANSNTVDAAAIANAVNKAAAFQSNNKLGKGSANQSNTLNQTLTATANATSLKGPVEANAINEAEAVQTNFVQK